MRSGLFVVYLSRVPPSLALAAVLAVRATAPLAAQPSPQGPELQVNTYTTGFQSDAAVAMDTQGGFIVTWNGPSEIDGSDIGIRAQRFDAKGGLLGTEFQVNTYANSGQFGSSVAMNEAGDFVVVWTSFGSDNGDTSNLSVQGQRFDASGLPVGNQFLVNTYVTFVQQEARVAMDSAGNFVVVWRNEGAIPGDLDGPSVQGQRFDANGIRIGSQFQVNTYTTSYQGSPSIAMNGSGEFVVTWNSVGSGGNDTDFSIQAQRYDGSGARSGSEFQVNSYTTSSQRFPSVAMDAAGEFVVVWESYGSYGDDTNYSIQGQRFSSSGELVGSQFQVNTYTTSGQRFPTVARDSAGSFVVVWDSQASDGDDDGYSVHGRQYKADGDPVGDQFQINTYTTYSQYASAVALDPAGNFVVTWQSDGSNGTDTDARSIQAQLYDGIFRDGLESGDTLRWSLTVP